MTRRRRGKAPSKAAKRRAERREQAAFVDELTAALASNSEGVFIELGPRGLRIVHGDTA